ncbi:MAG: VWA domain-containing protein [Acidobacteriota bacterium]
MATSLSFGAAAEQAPVSETLNVKRTNVDFVVTNAKGEPVHGLTADQFQVLENGKPQTITNFSEILSAADSNTASTVPRYIAIFFDNYSITPANRSRFIASLRTALKVMVRPGDRVAVQSWNRRTMTYVPFTTDLGQIDQALDKIGGEVGTSLEMERRSAEQQIEQVANDAALSSRPNPDTYSSGLSAARHYADTRTRDVKSSINAVGSYLSAMAGLDGRKVLILTGESLPLRPGAEIFQKLEMAKARMTSSQTGAPNLESGQYDLSRDVSALGAAANSAGVTVYAINPNGTSRSNSGSVENGTTGDNVADFAVVTSGIDGYQLLARETGGLALIGTNTSQSLASVNQDLSSYYSAAFASNTESGAGHTIEVRTTAPGARLRYARNVTVRSLGDDVSRTVMANQLNEPASNELGISLTAEPIQKLEGGKRKVGVVVMIPIARLLLQPDGQQVKGGFSVFFCSGDAKGEVSSVSSQRHDIAWPTETYAAAKAKSIGYRIEVVQDQPRDVISVGVVDENSQTTGYAKLNLAGPPAGR